VFVATAHHYEIQEAAKRAEKARLEVEQLPRATNPSPTRAGGAGGQSSRRGSRGGTDIPPAVVAPPTGAGRNPSYRIGGADHQTR
jgi:hypothetical protein